MTIEIQRLPPMNNAPHKWQWSIWEGSFMKKIGVADSKKEALTAVIQALESLKQS